MRPNILTLSIAYAFGGEFIPRPRTTALRYIPLKERHMFMMPAIPQYQAGGTVPTDTKAAIHVVQSSALPPDSPRFSGIHEHTQESLNAISAS